MKEWDQFWKEYQTSKAEQYYIMLRDKIIRRGMNKAFNKNNVKILEAGCGFGSNSRMFKKDPRFDVYCLDLSKEAINAVKKEINNSYVGDIQNMPFKDNTFDVVFSAGVIEHFKNDLQAVNELYRVTKKGGIIVTFVPGRYSLWQLYKLMMGKKWIHGYEKNYDPTDKAQAYQILEDAHKNGWLVTGLLYIDPEEPTLHDHFNLVEKPLNRLSDDEIRPSKDTLEMINKMML